MVNPLAPVQETICLLQNETTGSSPAVSPQKSVSTYYMIKLNIRSGKILLPFFFLTVFHGGQHRHFRHLFTHQNIGYRYIYSLKRVEGNEKCTHIVVVSKGRAFSRRTVRVIHLVPVVRATAHGGTSPEPIFFLF